jgi:hypothetical protein
MIPRFKEKKLDSAEEKKSYRYVGKTKGKWKVNRKSKV